MRISKTIATLLLALSFMQACADTQLGQAPVPPDYVESIREWKEYRIGRLTEPTGWLRTVDLIWLDEGENRFGSGESVDIRFPEGMMPAYAGTFTFQNEVVHMEVADGVCVTHQGQPVREMVIYDGSSDSERIELVHQDLLWFVDKRGDQLGIRIYHLTSPEADAFNGFPAYPLDESWHLQARFQPYESEKTIPVTNVLGETVETRTLGRVEFSIDGKRYSLDALEARSGLFLMFTDETNRTETYQAGRYIIIDFPDDRGHTVIDFNRAYNMPCSFSMFTTCQLPPPQNRLPVAVTAGEKRPTGWKGI